jgi:spermidine/putrescine transport system permease protein
MSATAIREPAVVAASPPPKPRSQKRWTRFILPVYTGLFIVYLIVPIAVMIVFGFNTPAGRYNIKWEHASLDAWRNLFFEPALTQSLILTLEVAVSATIISTIIGMFLGLALGRYRFRGSGLMGFVIFLAIASPEIVLGSSLLTMYVSASVPQGFVTLLLSHVMFCIAFVAITVRARVQGMDRSLEEAAGDLGADPRTTFFKVTLPLIFPGVISGALLAFALSIDDYVISNFVAGPKLTFPLWVYGATRQGLPPQVNVMGTILFLLGLTIVGAQLVGSKMRERRDTRTMQSIRALTDGVGERGMAPGARGGPPGPG